MYRNRRRCGARFLVHVATAGAAILVAGAGLLVAGAIPAAAVPTPATRYVALTGTDTDNDCTDQTDPCATIQYALGQAVAGDTISLAAGTYPQSADIRISVTVTGAGSDKTIIEGSSSEGSGDATLQIDGGDTETPPNVTIENLAVSNNAQYDGIDVLQATATLQDCAVSGNNQDGIYSSTQDDAQLGTPTVSISHCTVDDNGNDGVEVDDASSANVDHSAIDGNKDGGVVVESGSATVATTTLDHNVGAGVVADGSGTAVTVTDSTISNTKPFSDPEGDAYGGGVLVFDGGHATIETSTLSGNTGQGALADGGTVSIANSTITGTAEGEDGQAEDQPLASGAVVAQPGGEDGQSSLTLSGTVLADNTAPNCTVSGDGTTFTDAGYNLSDTAACAFTAAGSVNKRAAKLGALADNGGPTQTQLPAKGSAAIDAIPVGSAGCASTATDQRGDARLAGARCDIGAVEVAQPPVVVTPKTLPHGQVGTAYHLTLQATGGLGAPYEFSLAAGPLPAGLTLSTAGVISGTPTKSGTFTITVAVDDPTDQQFVIVIAAAPVTTTSSPPTTTTPTSTSTTTTPPTTSSNSPAPSTTTSTGPALADTGVQIGGMLGVAGTTILLGLALLLWASSFRPAARRRGRH